MDGSKYLLNPNAKEYDSASQSPCYNSSTAPQYNSLIQDSSTTSVHAIGVVGQPPTNSAITLFHSHQHYPAPPQVIYGPPPRNPSFTLFHQTQSYPPQTVIYGPPPTNPNMLTLVHPDLRYSSSFLLQGPRPLYHRRGFSSSSAVLQNFSAPRPIFFGPGIDNRQRFQSWPGMIPPQANVGAISMAQKVGPQKVEPQRLPTIALGAREHVSRAILVNGVPQSVTDDQFKSEMEQWGDVRAVDSSRKHNGVVIVAFYDIRHAQEALRNIQQQHLDKQKRMMQQYFHYRENLGRCESRDLTSSRAAAISAKGLVHGFVMWAQYTLPVGAAAGPDGENQGTLVVFNLTIDTTTKHLKSTFGAYGQVKEIRETPSKKRHKFVEFYDVRNAAKALEALDGTEINGNCVKIAFSRPGGNPYKAHAKPH